MRAAVSALVIVVALGFAGRPAMLQDKGAEKGGEDETGPYQVAEGWPQPWSKPGYIWGSQPAVFAQSPDRIFIGARGELKLPDTLPRGFNGMWGSLGQRATEPKAEYRNCLVVVDRTGKLVESWTQWDSLFDGSGAAQDPHQPLRCRAPRVGRERRQAPVSSSSRTTASAS